VHISEFGISYGSLANSAPASGLCLVSVISYLKLYCDFVGHDFQEVKGQVFFHRFFFKENSTLVVIQAIILAYNEYLRTEKYYVLTSCLSDDGGIVTQLSTITLGGSLACLDTTSFSKSYSPSGSCIL